MNLISLVTMFISLNLFGTELTLSTWSDFDNDTQDDLISYDSTEYSNLRVYDYSSPEAGVDVYSTVRDIDHQILGQKMWKLMEDNIYMDNSDDFYVEELALGLVGGPYQSDLRIVYLIEGENQHLLGISSSVHEVGCEMEVAGNQYSYSFDNEAQAKEAGCYFTDISWTANATVNGTFEFIYLDEWMEWTGW